MTDRIFHETLITVLAIGVLGYAPVAQAGIFDDLRGAIDTVREGTDTVKDAKTATQDAKDLLPDLPESEQDKPAPSLKSKPPSLPTATQWHVSIDGKSAGPFDQSKLPALISKGQVTRDSLVWKDGMADWVPAESINELSALFPKTPPPLPGN